MMIPVSSFSLYEAAAKSDSRNMEEEQLSPYSDKELADGWEFKILRSASGIFAEQERMREILDEEARAGWVLVEKFDSHRLRLKRSPEEGKHDRHQNFDVWRTQIGASQSKREARVALIIVGIMLAVLGFAALLGVTVFGPPG